MGTGLEDAGPSTSAGVGVGMGMLRMPVFRLPPSTSPPPSRLSLSCVSCRRMTGTA